MLIQLDDGVDQWGKSRIAQITTEGSESGHSPVGGHHQTNRASPSRSRSERPASRGHKGIKRPSLSLRFPTARSGPALIKLTHHLHESAPSGKEHDHEAVRTVRLRVDCRHRAGPACFRHPLAPAHQSDADLSPHGQPARGTAERCGSARMVGALESKIQVRPIPPIVRMTMRRC